MTETELAKLASKLSRTVPLDYNWEEVKDYCADHSAIRGQELNLLTTLVTTYLWMFFGVKSPGHPSEEEPR